MNRLTRRRLFRWAGGSVAVAAAGPHWPVLDAMAAKTNRLSAVSNPAHETSQPEFTALLVSWNGPRDDIPAIRVTVESDGGWSDWISLHVDHHVPEANGSPVYFNPLVQPGKSFAFDLSPDTARFVLVATVNTVSSTPHSLTGESDEGPDDPIELIDGFIIPRAGWGADESYRHNGQDPDKPIGWPPRYREIERVVVHHTDTAFGWEDPAAVVRAIYYYHAVVLDWTDIGYNFLIDGYGNVYEGRYGGPGVVGGHALEYNPGSIGVALIGNYSDTWPPAAAQDALVRLIQTRAPHIDPAVAADWIDWGDVPNICGHGDVIITACPGADIQAVLPSIRGRLGGTDPVYFPKPVLLYDPKIVSFSASPSLVEPGGLVEIRATVTTEGREPLRSQGPAPGFVYDEDDDFDSVGHHKVEERFRLAVDVVGSNGVRSPYRWGLGSSLEPGEEREIVGYIRMLDMGTRKLIPTVVREYVRHYEDEEIHDAVHVVHPLASRAADASEQGDRYFGETGHNVPVIFAEYWESQGGVNRFGFPLTEAFGERSATDGLTYLTQYFERARFEYHPELVDDSAEIQLGLLGTEMTAARLDETPFEPIEPFESQVDQFYFPETRHSTSYRFLEKWLAEGGVSVFGYPISEKFDEASPTDGRVRLVQYFERARFEYHPDESWAKQIKMGHLGREVLIERGWLPGPGVE